MKTISILSILVLCFSFMSCDNSYQERKQKLNKIAIEIGITEYQLSTDCGFEKKIEFLNKLHNLNMEFNRINQ